MWGGESRGAYACRLTFDPPQFLIEIYDHVTQFVRKPPLLIQFELMKVDQNWVFEQFMVTLLINCSKNHFWSTFTSSNWIKIKFSISWKADQKLVFEQIESRDQFVRREIEWIKSESTCICSTWLTSFTYFTGSKFGPPRTISEGK